MCCGPFDLLTESLSVFAGAVVAQPSPLVRSERAAAELWDATTETLAAFL